MPDQPCLKIVVAEDEELILNHIIKNIHQTGLGFVVAGAAQNGKQALAMIEAHSPDLLLTDIRMPVIDGLELLKNVTFHYPYIKTVIISGYSEFDYAKQAIRFGVEDYLLKPLEYEELWKVLEKIKLALETESLSLKNAIPHTEPAGHSPEEMVTIVAQFIKDHFNQGINLNSLAESFNFNASYLSKLFKKYYHETPVKYVLNLRIQEAKHLLHRQPELSVKTIGELVGYPDPFYFSRIFKQITGQSPSEFRLNHPGTPPEEG